jgi:uncharacterized protein DUF4279
MNQDPAMYDDEYPSCARTYVMFFIRRGDLDPDAVSRQMGIEPSETQRRGDPLDAGTRRPVIFDFGAWFLRSREFIGSRDALRHLDWLLDQLEPRGGILAALRAEGCEMGVLCYWLSAQGEGGPTLSPGSMGRLAALGLELGFGIYVTSYHAP